MSGIVILLMTCSKNMHKVEVARKTWLHQCNIPYVILIGNPTLGLPYRYDPATHIMEVQCHDDYESLSQKVYLGIVAVNSEFNPAGILKVDDDVLVRVDRLNAFINSEAKASYEGDIAKNTNYWSEYHIGKCKMNTPIFVPNIKYCRGPIYYLGREAIEIVCERMDPNDHLYEDVLMGMLLNNHSIYPRQQPFMTDYLDEFLQDKNIIALHDINDKIDLLKIENENNINTLKRPIVSAPDPPPILESTSVILILAFLVAFIGFILVFRQKN